MENIVTGKINWPALPRGTSESGKRYNTIKLTKKIVFLLSHESFICVSYYIIFTSIFYPNLIAFFTFSLTSFF